MSAAAVTRQAADWAALLDSDTATPEQRSACERWCDEAPQHRLTFERMRALDAPFQRLDLVQRQTLAQMAAQQTGRRRLRQHALFGVLLVLATGAYWLQLDRASAWQQDLRTARGEQTRVSLADASTLTLGADSAVQSRFDHHQRRIELLHGRLLAEVSADRQRPFVVQTAQATATALGTAFVVQRDADSTRVAVVESTVKVCVVGGSPCVVLGRGEQVRVDAHGLSAVLQRDPRHAVAWTQGWIEVDDCPVAQVLDELNPYLPAPVQFDAGALSGIHVTGSFPLTQPQRALTAVLQTARLRLHTVAGETGGRVSR